MKLSYPGILWLLVVGTSAVSLYQPHDVFTWFLEAAPVLIGLVLFPLLHRRYPLTLLLYSLLAIHAVILLVGAHYTYARVPLFTTLQDVFGFARNHYDRVGHFAQGFIPAMLAREYLLRATPLKSDAWLVAIVVLSILGISACYELIEWGVALFTGEAAESFLGTQGDPWDTQADMFFAGLGAISALTLLSHWHNRQLAHSSW